MTMRPFTRLRHGSIALLLSGGLLLSCGRSFSPDPVVQSYVIDPTVSLSPAPPVHASTALLSRPSGQRVLVVSEPRAEAGFDTPAIAYTRSPQQLEYYTQSRWADTPARLIKPMLIQQLDDSRLFHAVVPAPSVGGDLRLDVNIIRLQQELLSRPSQVRLVLRAKLVDIATSHILGTQLFEVVEPAPSDDAVGAVQAAGRAVQQALTQVRTFVARYTPEAMKRG